jgi:hypothetical protein
MRTLANELGSDSIRVNCGLPSQGSTHGVALPVDAGCLAQQGVIPLAPRARSMTMLIDRRRTQERDSHERRQGACRH